MRVKRLCPLWRSSPGLMGSCLDTPYRIRRGLGTKKGCSSIRELHNGRIAVKRAERCGNSFGTFIKINETTEVPEGGALRGAGKTWLAPFPQVEGGGTLVDEEWSRVCSKYSNSKISSGVGFYNSLTQNVRGDFSAVSSFSCFFWIGYLGSR